MTAAAAYSAGAVARRLGVAVTTLRTWHQRYGMGPSLHEPGHHRRYTEQDIERLEVMQRLIVEGVAPSEAARWALQDARVPGLFGPASSAVAPAPAPFSSSSPDLVAAARGLHRAAVRLDAPAVRQRVAAAVHDLGVVVAWDNVLRPVLSAIGQRHAATGGLVEVEHLLSGCVSAVFGAVPRPEPTLPAQILLACADEEQHSLPLEAVGAALAASGVPTRMLGARVPPSALAGAVRRTGPLAVLVWSQLRTTGDPGQLEPILTMPRRPLVVAAAGPGWDVAGLPPGVSTPANLTEALVMLTAALA
ncbi:MerR family transcriptional regulator [Dactylosporangium aurantiacum]|uniref:MerR family transcriptional regulator n=1 Tax=Dactylosporangium aurantiacum TaxID=35754 RepID=A0A9Q9MMA9_9ACTN|nr:MerR family transcriptional regulator [Dactylosporangium aurantiacum]MDG6109086.1 MerR family transcriptional regulator [Dactylosporangium aurantiacum]UWZ54582.1 MerR family transcriptional regulator [Dactylosporangium aurantiacum]